VEKYRPSTMDELIAHEEIISIISRLIESGKLPHLLFYGPPGTGKVNMKQFKMQRNNSLL
jgi:replication factor C subunit 3/5